MSLPTLCLAADVPAAFAEIARAALERHGVGPFRLACSGGGSGRAVMEALVAAGFAFERTELFQVDERCVPADSPDSNARSLLEVLGPAAARLVAFHRMSCDDGPSAYGAAIEAAGGSFELIQLGMGPDGHTASLFPGSEALMAPADQLVAANRDPSGRNRHDRITLTYAGIARGALVVVTAFGPDKHEPLERLAAGEDLPIGRVAAKDLVFLVDAAAAGALPVAPLPQGLVPAAR